MAPQEEVSKPKQTFNAPHHATSPVVNLAGVPTMPLTAWVLQGSSTFNGGCGEEPDSGEDLEIQYIDSGGNWQTLNTWLGSTSGGTVQQWSTNLPSAALHANTQIRIEQISGSGSGLPVVIFGLWTMFTSPHLHNLTGLVHQLGGVKALRNRLQEVHMLHFISTQKYRKVRT